MQKTTGSEPFRNSVLGILFQASLVAFTYLLLSSHLTDRYLSETGAQRRAHLKQVTEVARNTLAVVVERFQAGELSRKEAIAQAKGLVQRMTYRDHYGRNYVFLGEYDGTLLVQPFRRELEGVNNWDLKDDDGVFVIRKLIRLAKERKSGYLTYRYHHPDKTADEEKLSYVQAIPELSCFIGTGIYMGDVYAAQRGFLVASMFPALGGGILLLILMLFLIRDLERRNRGLSFEIAERMKTEAALRQSEERYRIACEQPGQMVYDYEIASGNIRWLGNILEITGASPEEFQAVDFAAWGKMIHPADRGLALERLEEAQDRCERYQVEYRFRKKDGAYCHIEDCGMFLSDGSGASCQMLGMMRDISDWKRTENEVRKLNGDLERRVIDRTLQYELANRRLEKSLKNLKEAQSHLVESEKMAALGSLVAGVAHEINTPVGIGITEASYLSERSESIQERYAAGKMTRTDFERYLETAGKGAKAILDNLQRAGELVQSFKQVAADRTSEDRREFRVKRYIEGILLSMHSEFKRTTHLIDVTCDEDVTLTSYPGPFSQVVTNLIMNSLTHGFGGMEGGRIGFFVEVEGGNVTIRYRDNGRGMEEATRKQVFEPFFTTRRGEGGTGLGMHVAYNLVTGTLGGRIECESAPGKGAEFTMTIPAANS